jgi:YVTN family beta-propeller protein
VPDKNGILYFTQNNWGSEVQFLGRLMDEVRLYDSGRRIALADTVTREITQRILEYDDASHRLYLVRVGESSESDPSVLQVVDPDSQRVEKRIELGLVATDLVFDDDHIYVANFGSDHVLVIDEQTYAVREVTTGEAPLRLCHHEDQTYVLTHIGNTLQQLGDDGAVHEIPHEGLPDNAFSWGDKVVITSHSASKLFVIAFDPARRSFQLLHEQDYPYGDTRFDTGNVSFYVDGQFGDVVFSITRGEVDGAGRLWLTDFLSGKVLIFADR